MDSDIDFRVDPVNTNNVAADTTTNAVNTATDSRSHAATGTEHPVQRGRSHKRKRSSNGSHHHNRKLPARSRSRSPDRSLSPDAVSKLIYLIRHRQRAAGEWPSIKYLNELAEHQEQENEEEKQQATERSQEAVEEGQNDVKNVSVEEPEKKKRKRRRRKKKTIISDTENDVNVNVVRGGEPASPPPPVVVCVLPEALRLSQGTDPLALRQRQIFYYVQSSAWKRAASNNLKPN